MSIGFGTIFRGDFDSGESGAMSALATYLQHERERRNWTVLEFAQRAALPDTTLTRILNDEVAEVKASQIAHLAKALDMEFWKLMQIAGFTTETPGDPDEEAARIATLITADPDLKATLERASKLSPANRQAVLAYIELLQRQQNGVPPAQESQ